MSDEETREILDLYNKDIDTVLVQGDEAYRDAKDFMRMLIPSHAKNVQPYRDKIPLFHRFQVETALEQMVTPTVQLKSGGYIVIDTTEADTFVRNSVDSRLASAWAYPS